MKESKNAPPSDRLPAHLPVAPRRERVTVTDFGGLSLRNAAPDGIADMENLSPHRAPALAVRTPRERLAEGRGEGTPHGMATVGGTLYFAEGQKLFRIRGGADALRTGVTVETVGSLSDTDKQMAVFGDRLIILPDKKYVDEVTGQLQLMEIETGTIEGVRFEERRIILPIGYNWTSFGFAAGDSLTIINEDDQEPAPEGTYCIQTVHLNIAVLRTPFLTSSVSHARFRRTMPDMDGICVAGNRLCGYKGKTVYVGGEGGFCCFGGERPDGGGPATLRLDSEGDITAIAPWRGDLLLFKTDRICRLLGGRADSAALSEMAAPGVPAALSRTLCEVEGDLYYYSDTGVCRLAYGRSYPERLRMLTDAPVTGGVGGTDGRGYYLSLRTRHDGQTVNSRTYLYMPDTGAWYVQGTPSVEHAVYSKGYLCTQDTDGTLWLCRADGRRAGKGMTESDASGPIRASVTFLPDHRYEPEGYYLVKLYLRATAAPGGELRVLASFGEGYFCRDADLTATDPHETVELAVFEGGMSDRLLCIPVISPRCDSVVLRLEMVGEWEISSMVREYEVKG